MEINEEKLLTEEEASLLTKIINVTIDKGVDAISSAHKHMLEDLKKDKIFNAVKEAAESNNQGDIVRDVLQKFAQTKFEEKLNELRRIQGILAQAKDKIPYLKKS